MLRIYVNKVNNIADNVTKYRGAVQMWLFYWYYFY